jgi:hypothetical protein
MVTDSFQRSSFLLYACVYAIVAARRSASKTKDKEPQSSIDSVKES